MFINQSWRCGPANTFYFSTEVCRDAWPHHQSFILLTGMKCLARLFARGLNNLCAALRFSVAMPKDGQKERWHVCQQERKGYSAQAIG
jgi:hypothetical protein